MDYTRLENVDDIISGEMLNSESFKEFCEALDELSLIADPELYLEAVTKADDLSLKHWFSTVKKNTASTTADVGTAYGNIVNGNTRLIKSTWDLMMRSLNLITRIIGFVLGKISYIPRLIIKGANKVMDLPSDVVNKIRGNIKLYITVGDIANLYNADLLLKVHNFMALARLFARGDAWTTFFNNKKNIDGYQMKENDMKLCRKMKKEYEQLKLLQFNPTVIEMKDEKTRKTYFGSEKSVKFKDLEGKEHESTYYEALNKLIEDLQKEQDSMKDILDAVGKKFTETKMNASFSQMHTGTQYRIQDSITMISKVITVIGNIIRYVNSDINTINEATDKLLGKQSTAVKKK